MAAPLAAPRTDQERLLTDAKLARPRGLRIGINVGNLMAIGRKHYSDAVYPGAPSRQFTTSSEM
jgi:hypothetical protein